MSSAVSRYACTACVLRGELVAVPAPRHNWTTYVRPGVLNRPLGVKPWAARQGSEDVQRPELHRDPRAAVGDLGHGVLPGALAGAAHHHEIAVAHLDGDRLA